MGREHTVAVAKLGKRAENKAEKLRRITTAARELFVEKGFDGTTMRDIATRAGVGFGTLFDYASNKRDLLFLIVNPQLESVLDDAIVAAESEATFLDRLMTMFGAYYAFYAREKGISRIVLRELTFFTEGSEAKKFVSHRSRFLDVIVSEVGAAVEAGQLRAVAPDIAARLIFALYAWEIRRWLAGAAPSVMRGMADLREMLALQISGLEPTA